MTGIHTITRALALSIGLAASAQAQVTLSSTNNPSLVLLIWDPVAKVSYSHDTNLLGTSLYNSTSQSTTGSQQFWTIDPGSDTSFAKFLQTSGDLSNDVWMVIGGGKATQGIGAGSNVIFSTMVNTTANGVLNPQWPFLKGVTNSLLRGRTGAFSSSLYNPLMNGNGTAYNNYATAAPGKASSFDTPASNAYVGSLNPVLSDALTGTEAGEAMFGGNGLAGQGFDTGNTLGTSGSSSWFYYMTPSGNSQSALSTVSAFSTSSALAYWGLARTTNAGGQQELVLSFTVPAAVSQTATAAGALRRNQTDYTAQFGFAQQITVAHDEFAGWKPTNLLGDTVAPVPEPDTYGLMLFGLAGIAAYTRRRRSR